MPGVASKLRSLGNVLGCHFKIEPVSPDLLAIVTRRVDLVSALTGWVWNMLTHSYSSTFVGSEDEQG
jgi:hypothetical protein